jgi:hypothetical protein
MRDSGGVHPWGEAIFVPCDCAAPAQPAGERVLLRRKIKLGAMNSGTGPWMQVFDKTDHYNDAEFAWATIERC